MNSRIYLVFLFVIIVILGHLFDLEKSILLSIASIGLLSVELIFYFKINKALKEHSDEIFSMKSNQWMLGILAIGYFIYIIINENFNIWTLIAVVSIFSYGLLNMFINRNNKYLINRTGIVNLNSNKKIKSEDITGITLQDQLISINTVKYRNDLVIKSSELTYPKWDKLVELVKKINKNVG